MPDRQDVIAFKNAQHRIDDLEYKYESIRVQYKQLVSIIFGQEIQGSFSHESVVKALKSKLVVPSLDTKILDWFDGMPVFDKMHHNIIQPDGHYSTWTIKRAWDKEITRTSLREAAKDYMIHEGSL